MGQQTTEAGKERCCNARVWYLALSDAPARGTVGVSDDVLVDVDAKGGAIGVAFLAPPSALDADVLAALLEGHPAIQEALAARRERVVATAAARAHPRGAVARP